MFRVVDITSCAGLRPEVEVDLCGHATVASAHVIFDLRREVAGKRVSFQVEERRARS